jgi:bis(5'-nucleosidyl)-tetraphosphatase
MVRKRKTRTGKSSRLKKVKSCGVVVFRDEPERAFLLMEHADRIDLPKGHMEPGEDETTCALRELEEETGISADEIELDPGFRYVQVYYPNEARLGGEQVRKKLVLLLGRLREPVTIQVSEHQGYHWQSWPPQGSIQKRTIDPLVQKLHRHFGTSPEAKEMQP